MGVSVAERPLQTRWTITGIQNEETDLPGLHLTVSVDTDSPAVIASIEQSMSGNGFEFERDLDWDLLLLDRSELEYVAQQHGVADTQAMRNSQEMIDAIVEKRKESTTSDAAAQ
jgi:hypothetical protein